MDSDAFLKEFNLSNKKYNDNEIMKLSKLLSEKGLKLELRPYQYQGILFMKDRFLKDETVQVNNCNIENGYVGYLPLQMISFSQQQKSQTLWFSLETYELSFKDPELIKLPKSCILADEMGTGKTIQVLSLIIILESLNPMKQAAKRAVVDVNSVDFITSESDLVSCFYPKCSSLKNRTTIKKNCNKFIEHPFVSRNIRNQPIHICLDCVSNWRKFREDCCKSGVLQQDNETNEDICALCSDSPDEIIMCLSCPRSFCHNCIRAVVTANEYKEIDADDEWRCMICINNLGTDIVKKENYKEIENENKLINNNILSNRNQDIIDLNQYFCGCGRNSITKKDGGWIQCTKCKHYLHVRCANFKDIKEAENCKDFQCIACTCLHYYQNILETKTTLIIMVSV